MEKIGSSLRVGSPPIDKAKVIEIDEEAIQMEKNLGGLSKFNVHKDDKLEVDSVSSSSYDRGSMISDSNIHLAVGLLAASGDKEGDSQNGGKELEHHERLLLEARKKKEDPSVRKTRVAMH